MSGRIPNPFASVTFVASVHTIAQLPPPAYPEIAFAGRSNVGKSSLINRLVNRKHLVKTSARPGKTRSLNFFQAGQDLYLVDLPGYGFARVSRSMQNRWQHLVTAYLETRETLRCVVVIIDIRHALKQADLEMVTWLRHRQIPCLPVYTKIDKVSNNARQRQATALDAGLGVAAAGRILFSARTGDGVDYLIEKLDMLIS